MKKRHARRKGREGRAAWRLPSWLDARAAALVLAVKALLLLYGVQAFVVWKNERLGSLYDWLAIWNRWDAPHYLDIARMGYVSQGVEARWIVFYPLYPWLVRVAAFVLRDELLGAFFVSGLASIAVGVLLYKLARLDETEEVARASVFYLLIFPTSYFLHIGYTESLFLALTLGSFAAARARCWWAAGLLGGLAALTRVNGLLLLPALVFEACEQYLRSESGRGPLGWLWLLLVPAGFGVYLFINWWVLGDPRAFLNAQGDYWYKSLTWPWVGIQEAWNSVLGACAFGGADGRVAGAFLRAARARADGLGMAEPAHVLRHLDDVQLASLDEHEVRAERAALHAGALPGLHPVCTAARVAPRRGGRPSSSGRCSSSPSSPRASRKATGRSEGC